MATRKARGPQGTTKSSPTDGGTLARTASDTPGINLSFSWNPDAKEGITKSIPIKRAQAYKQSDGLAVAAVYFPVDVDKLDLDDKIALAPLVESLVKRVGEGFLIRLFCTGEADFRASREYNRKLGRRRAESVRKYIAKMVPSPLLKIEVKSIGESKALQPRGGRRPSLKAMAADRKVSILIDKNGLVPPLLLAFEGSIFHSKTLEMMEYHNGGKIMTRKDESRDPFTERSETGREHDPFKAIVIVKTQYLHRSAANSNLAKIRCEIIHTPSGKRLFKPVEIWASSPSTVDYKSAYDELKGKYRNICERIKKLLGRPVMVLSRFVRAPTR